MGKSSKHQISRKSKRFLLIFLPALLLGIWTASAQAMDPSSMVTPPPGTVLTTPEVSFSWTPGQEVSEIWLGIGTTQLSVEESPWGNIYAQSQGLGTSVTVSGIPLTGQPIYVRLWSKINGEWVFKDYEYDTQPPSPQRAMMITPTPGTVLTTSEVSFSWSAGQEVSEIWLGIGTTQLSVEESPWGNIYAQSQGLGTSVTVSGIPLTGQPIYVRLWSKINGEWVFKDYEYDTQPPSPQRAMMITPTPGTVLTTSEVSFSWSAGQEVSEIWLGIGTTLLSVTEPPWGDIYAQSQGLGTSVTVSSIPLTGQPIYVRLWSKINGEWVFEDYAYDTSDTPPIIEFRSFPDSFDTNLGNTIIPGKVSPGDMVRVNNLTIETDNQGNFVTKIPLTIGGNVVELIVDTENGAREIVSKIINYNPQYSTADRRLIYVDVVDVRPTGEPEGLDGTILIDIDKNVVLGFIEGKHIRGIAHDGRQIFLNDKTVINTEFHQTTTLTLSCSLEDIPSNAFLVSPLGDFVICGDEVIDLITNSVRPENLPVSILTGTSFGGAPTSGGPAISPESTMVFAGPIRQPQTTVSRIARISLQDNSMDLVAALSGPFFLSDLTVSPNNRYLMHVSYCCRNGVRIFDMQDNFSLKGIIGAGDFSGEIVFTSNGEKAIAGSAGNPLNRGGGLTVINMDSFESESVVPIDLADNLTITHNDEIVVSSGNRVGLDVFVILNDGTLERMKSFFLGVNKFVPSSGIPRNDEIRRIIYKSNLN